nr:hypothetical protein [uncultured Sphingomonas sp.]
MNMNVTIKKAVQTVRTKITKTKPPIHQIAPPRSSLAYAAALEILG